MAPGQLAEAQQQQSSTSQSDGAQRGAIVGCYYTSELSDCWDTLTNTKSNGTKHNRAMILHHGLLEDQLFAQLTGPAAH